MSLNISDLDPLSQEFSSDLWNHLAELRSCPVAKTERYGGIWLLSRYDDVVGAARDWQTFTSSKGAGQVPLAKVKNIRLMPIEVDPPLQRSLRRLIDKHFGPKSMPGAAGLVRRTARKLMSDFEDGRCEFIEDFAVPYPAINFFEYAFGVGVDESDSVMHWIEQMLTVPDRAEEAIMSFFQWTRGLLEARRSSEPRDDVIGSLLTGTIEDRALTDDERMMVIMNLIIGGIETTTHVLGNIAAHLASRPDLRDRLNAERTLIPAAVEEFLRYETPAPGLGRTATCPVRIGDAEISEDERIIMYFGSANRDPDAYDNADEIVLDRFSDRAKPHLTFGAGVHRCPGAHFARLELQIAIEEILDRLPSLSIGDGDLEFSKGLARGHKRLPLTFGPVVQSAE